MPLLKEVRADDGPAGHQVVLLQDRDPLDAAGGRQDHAGSLRLDGPRFLLGACGRCVLLGSGSPWLGGWGTVVHWASSRSVRAVSAASGAVGRISMGRGQRSSVAWSRPSSAVSLRSSSDTGMLLMPPGCVPTRPCRAFRSCRGSRHSRAGSRTSRPSLPSRWRAARIVERERAGHLLCFRLGVANVWAQVSRTRSGARCVAASGRRPARARRCRVRAGGARSLRSWAARVVAPAPVAHSRCGC